MSEPIEILLVEDNPGDARLTVEALRDARITNRLSVVGDGEEALAFMRGQGRFAGGRPPDLVLLDLNLPRMNGREVLAVVKNDPDLRRIPIVVLTSSRSEEDVVRSYDLHANAFVTKPVDMESFMRVVHGIAEFWLTVVKLPPGAERHAN